MTNVTRIKSGPHPTPRPGDYEHLPGRFEQLPDGLKTKVFLGLAGAALVVGSVFALGAHQDKPNSNSPQPTQADYDKQEKQPLNGS